MALTDTFVDSRIRQKGFTSMLDWLRRLFGGNSVDMQEEAPGSRPLPVVRVSAGEGENAASASGTGEAHDSAFFCREALVGRDQKIIGYEFGYPRHLHPRLMEKRVRLRQYHDDLLLRHLAGLELDSFLGERLALIEISHASLEHPSLAALLRRKIVLLLCFPETGIPDARRLPRIMTMVDRLRANGAHLGLKWQSNWQADFPLLPHLDFVQIAWPDCTGTDCAAFLSGLRQAAGTNLDTPREAPLRLIVGGLQTPDDFRQCYRLGVDLFRGEFIDSRDRERESKSAINRLRVLQLMNELRQNADTASLEEELKQDPVLSYRLLAYVNSPLLGMMDKITHLGHAMTIVGRNDLYRWLASLLFNVADPGYYEWALTEQALARAALMERLGRGVADVKPDTLFLTGLFSLLDQLMGKPMEELVMQIRLAEDIQVALTRRQGILAQFLSLAEACERMDPETIAQKAEALGLSSRTVSLAVFDALAWAHAMTRLNAE
jgi:EAL and modified HD-GYP domain-containing signal transduction protein